MTGRERVLRAYRHEEVDRTPIGEMYEIAPPTREVILGKPCGFAERMEMLRGANWETIVETEARDIMEIAVRLGFDMIGVRRNIPPNFERPEPISKYRWETSGIIYEYLPESGIHKSIAKGSKSSPPEEYINKEVVQIPEPEFYVFRRVKELMQERGIELAIFSPVYGIPVATLGERLEWFHTQPERLHQFYDECTRNVISNAEKLVEAGADIIGLGGDLACDRGPMISPKHYHEFIMPQIRKQADALHEAGAFVNNTSDGILWPILDDFLIGTHVDGFGEIDKAAGMDLARLKREYGERICFVGNLDIRWTFTRGTPGDCRREMIKCIQDGWGNGGHVICTSNIVHKDVKPENYLAALDAYHEYFEC
jgi:uroporphyrinogen-III decarboxylase